MSGLLQRPLFWVGAVVLAASVAGLLATWPKPASAGDHGEVPGRYSEVDVYELQQAAEGGALVIDVREPHEFAAGRVRGSVLVPLGSVEARSVEFDARTPVYVICRSGNRSAVASESLVAAGFESVHNVTGGMLAWEAAGLPVER